MCIRDSKAADRIAAYFEATRLAGFSGEEATIYFGEPKGLAGKTAHSLAALDAWPANEAQRAFLGRFRDLIERL